MFLKNIEMYFVMNLTVKFTLINIQKEKQKGKILIIGDSFSEQDNYGYKNYLAEQNSVLYIDRFLSGNQIQTLYELSNGDFLKSIILNM